LIHTIWLSDVWRDIWTGLGITVESFAALKLSADSSDAVVWRRCQRENVP
jgi:hypothetical protein